MSLYDVTATLGPGLPAYEGEPGPALERIAAVASGDPATVSVVRMGVHSGTHVDAPAHLFPGGAGADTLSLDAMLGPAEVIALDVASVIMAADLQSRVPPGAERLLLKTRNGLLWDRPGFQTDYVGLAPDAAVWLVRQGVRLVGIEYLSIEPYHTPGLPAHRTLLQAGVVVLEGLDLRAVPPGPVLLHCLPIKLEGADGAPARVVLTTP
jgi:arylformamidase